MLLANTAVLCAATGSVIDESNTVLKDIRAKLVCIISARDIIIYYKVRFTSLWLNQLLDKSRFFAVHVMCGRRSITHLKR